MGICTCSAKIMSRAWLRLPQTVTGRKAVSPLRIKDGRAGPIRWCVAAGSTSGIRGGWDVTGCRCDHAAHLDTARTLEVSSTILVGASFNATVKSAGAFEVLTHSMRLVRPLSIATGT